MQFNLRTGIAIPPRILYTISPILISLRRCSNDTPIRGGTTPAPLTRGILIKLPSIFHAQTSQNTVIKDLHRQHCYAE